MRYQTVHAVLADSALIISRNRKVETVSYHQTPIMTYADMFTLAIEHDITHVWIMPGVQYMVTDTNEQWDVFSSNAGYARIQRKLPDGKMSRQVKIGDPERGRWLWQIDSPMDILAAVYYLEQVLDVPCEWSPGHMATDVVRQLNHSARRASWVKEATANLFELPFNDAAQDIIWKSALLESDLGLYLHQFDKRSSYLSACGDLYVGEGDPVHLTPGSNVPPIDTSLPGIYRVFVDGNRGVFDNAALPAIATTGWITADLLAFAKRQGYTVNVSEAWQWTEKHKTLATYADTIWNGRKAFKDEKRFPHTTGRENAEATMKEVALIGTGKFASEKSGAFRQPYWWAAVVSKARIIMLANMHKAYAAGHTPVLAYSDSVYYLSTDPNPESAVPEIYTCGSAKTGLGQFRCEGTWEVDQALVDVFKKNESAIVGYLNRREVYHG